MVGLTAGRPWPVVLVDTVMPHSAFCYTQHGFRQKAELRSQLLDLVWFNRYRNEVILELRAPPGRPREPPWPQACQHARHWLQCINGDNCREAHAPSRNNMLLNEHRR